MSNKGQNTSSHESQPKEESNYCHIWIASGDGLDKWSSSWEDNLKATSSSNNHSLNLKIDENKDDGSSISKWKSSSNKTSSKGSNTNVQKVFKFIKWVFIVIPDSFIECKLSLSIEEKGYNNTCIESCEEYNTDNIPFAAKWKICDEFSLCNNGNHLEDDKTHDDGDDMRYMIAWLVL